MSARFCSQGCRPLKQADLVMFPVDSFWEKKKVFCLATKIHFFWCFMVYQTLKRHLRTTSLCKVDSALSFSFAIEIWRAEVHFRPVTNNTRKPETVSSIPNKIMTSCLSQTGTHTHVYFFIDTLTHCLLIRFSLAHGIFAFTKQSLRWLCHHTGRRPPESRFCLKQDDCRTCWICCHNV